MQFTGNSLLVHQSISVPWDFYLVPYFSQPTNAVSFHNCLRNVSLPSGASLWNGMFCLVEGQYTTPLSLANSQGSLVKTNKTKLLHALETHAENPIVENPILGNIYV